MNIGYFNYCLIYLTNKNDHFAIISCLWMCAYLVVQMCTLTLFESSSPHQGCISLSKSVKNPPGTSQNWHINGSNVGVFTHWVGITLILHVLQWSQYTERNGERGKNSILFVIKQKTSVSAITASVQNWTKSYDTTYMWNLKKKSTN